MDFLDSDHLLHTVFVAVAEPVPGQRERVVHLRVALVRKVVQDVLVQALYMLLRFHEVYHVLEERDSSNDITFIKLHILWI